ncbi:hypothetical protein HHK36_012802 [Tetracentron sinense]|uniref:Uncharacterized protein n=1 Tax=Tetracentron sinense TaxID=13715 RepID=A0A834Z7H5_TETSI|nr:hypothetical protein HHK36_012802 [Tetracentron sinense]
MAETLGKNSGTGSHRRHASRLQRQAPASIQVSPPSSFASGWKVAIPLLSPLVASPSSPKFGDLTPEVKEQPRQDHQFTVTEKPVFKKWQHPAAAAPAPFCYAPAPFVPQCR